jgi:hypothetical protein
MWNDLILDKIGMITTQNAVCSSPLSGRLKQWTQRDQRLELVERTRQIEVCGISILSHVATIPAADNGGSDSGLVQHPRDCKLGNCYAEPGRDGTHPVSNGKTPHCLSRSEQTLEEG